MLASILLSGTIVFSSPKTLSVFHLLVSSRIPRKCPSTSFSIVLIFNLIFSAYSLHFLFFHVFHSQFHFSCTPSPLNSNILSFSHILFSPFSYLYTSIFSQSRFNSITDYTLFFYIFSFLALCSITNTHFLPCYFLSHFSHIHFHTFSAVVLSLVF